MKYILKYKYLLLSFLIGLGILLSDLYIFHGYIIGGLTSSRNMYTNTYLPNINNNDADSILYYDYSVKWEDEDNLVFNLKNNGIGCQYIIHYRNAELISNIKEELPYALPSLYKISSLYKTEEKKLQFDCGTGLGISTFCPFESVSHNISLKELAIKKYGFPLFDFFKIEDESIGYDITSNISVFKLEYTEQYPILTWNMDYICNEKDSIELQFHYPVHSVWDKKERKIYSNKIKVPYCKLTRHIINHLNNHPNNIRIKYASFSDKENI